MAIPAYYSLIQRLLRPDEALAQTWLNGVRPVQLLPCTDHRRPLWHQERKRRKNSSPEQYEHGRQSRGQHLNALTQSTPQEHVGGAHLGIVMRTGMSGGTIRLIQQKLNTLGRRSARTESSAPDRRQPAVPAPTA